MNLSSKIFPPVYLITPNPSSQIDSTQFISELEKSLINGIRLVQLRATNLEPAMYKKLAAKVAACCKQYDATLLLNAAPELVDEVGADGVHLNGARLAAYERRPLNSNKLISAACHSLEQLKKAEALGVDIVTLSPVLPTASHPGEETLGWENFASMARQTTLPVYALGGMNGQMLQCAQDNGAVGVAGIRAFWGV